MFSDLKLNRLKPVYLQIKDYIKELIISGVLSAGAQLPSTRELAAILKVSRNTIIQAYQFLADDGFIRMEQGQGAFVASVEINPNENLFTIEWPERLTPYAERATELDIEKHELKWEKGMISFKSIAPDEHLFDVDEFKRAFLNRFALEGAKLLNYGYAQGYRPLLEYLTQYMKNKGVNPEGKALLVTNGFTEGLHLVLAALTRPGDGVVCENPTHNTALKIMKLLGLSIQGIPMRDDGLDVTLLEETLQQKQPKIGFLIPSYHNPTGLVMPLEKRLHVIQAFAAHRVPVLEDGFNEELRYSGSHVAPLIALAGKGNGIVYLGSFSKILFPGLRIGWIMADQSLISQLESVKRSYNIHTSFLDQAMLYEYLQSGSFERYLKKARRVYKERHENAIRLVKEHIPNCKVWGEGGLHIFIELENINAREVLAECYRRGVLFLPGDIFYTDGGGKNTFRLGISRIGMADMERGIKIIGEVIQNYINLR